MGTFVLDKRGLNENLNRCKNNDEYYTFNSIKRLLLNKRVFTLSVYTIVNEKKICLKKIYSMIYEI